MANDLNDLDGAEGGPQPAEGRELVIVDLGRTTMMPPSSLEYGAAAPVGMTRDSVYINRAMTPESPCPASGVMAGVELSALRVRR